jgi:DNA-directed RNA polymerase specialized sigma24 family protein
LKTYFIGQCVLRFGNVYRRWCRKEAPERIDALEIEALRAPPRPTPGRLVDLARGWASLPGDSVRRMEALVEMGFTHEEIATQLGVTKRSVSSKIFRNRQGEP